MVAVQNQIDALLAAMCKDVRQIYLKGMSYKGRKFTSATGYQPDEILLSEKKTTLQSSIFKAILRYVPYQAC